MGEPRLYAVRGAVTLSEDTREQVVSRTQTLLDSLLGRNGIERDDIVSIVFTATADVHAEFPAAAARMMGMVGVPLLCARELEVTSSLAVPLCIRVMIHFYGTARPEPVYLGDAARLLDMPEEL